jgi:hypothetical protein
VAVGWGDRGFYVETPRWADLKASTVFHALFVPSESVLHVEYLEKPVPGDYLHEVLVTREQYQRIVEFVRATVGAVDERGAARLASEVTYGPIDRFYAAHGSYHLFNSCNQWTGRGLKRAGVPVGIWTPLKVHVLWWLPRQHAPDRGRAGRLKGDVETEAAVGFEFENRFDKPVEVHAAGQHAVPGKADQAAVHGNDPQRVVSANLKQLVFSVLTFKGVHMGKSTKHL